MKILYIGHFRDTSGYSAAAINYVLAMNSVGINVVPRTFKLNDANPAVPAKFLELEQKDASNPDVTIQHTLPNYFTYDSRAGKQIGCFATETSNIPPDWANRCNLMDAIWVFNNQSKQCCIDSGVTVPIRVVPHAFDMEKYERSYQTASFRQKYPRDFFFYTIGEFNERKNLGAILKAFHTEFDPSEPVQLLIKTSIPGQNPAQAREILANYCAEIKRGLRLYDDLSAYKGEIVVTDYVPDDIIMSIHQSCDCFVSASRGEAVCIPAVEARAMSRKVICPKHTAFIDYVGDYCIPVDCIAQTCYNSQTVPGLQTGRDSWWDVSTTDLREAMRLAYKLRNQNHDGGLEQINMLSYENVGNLIKGILCNDG